MASTVIINNIKQNNILCTTQMCSISVTNYRLKACNVSVSGPGRD